MPCKSHFKLRSLRTGIPVLLPAKSAEQFHSPDDPSHHQDASLVRFLSHIPYGFMYHSSSFFSKWPWPITNLAVAYYSQAPLLQFRFHRWETTAYI